MKKGLFPKKHLRTQGRRWKKNGKFHFYLESLRNYKKSRKNLETTWEVSENLKKFKKYKKKKKKKKEKKKVSKTTKNVSKIFEKS